MLFNIGDARNDGSPNDLEDATSASNVSYNAQQKMVENAISRPHERSRAMKRRSISSSIDMKKD